MRMMTWMLGGLMIVAGGIAEAEMAHLELVAQPCLAKNILAGICVKDRATGREQFVMTNSSEETGLELFFIDIEKNTGQVFKAPAGQGSWALKEIPGDQLIIGTYYDGTFILFDLKQMAFTKTIKVPKEEYIWNVTMGGDGRIYGGTYPGGKLIALDLQTLAIEDCGNPALPNMYLQGLSTLPDGRIIGNFGYEQPVTKIYDPATKTFSPAPDHLKAMSGITWKNMYLAGSGACQGTALEMVTPYPVPAPDSNKGGWFVEVSACRSDRLTFHQGNTLYTWREGDAELTRLAEVELRGGRVLAASSSGAVLGIRGQDYFVIRQGDGQLNLRPMPVEGSPRPILFLRADSKGRLWGGPNFGQTLCMYDPAGKDIRNTGTVCDGGGEVYDAAFLNDKVYAASYAGGDITEYDPAQPWDQLNKKNPRPVAALAARGYIRPKGGIMAIKAGTPDARLYSGWMAKYGTYGGAVACTDPVSGTTELFENPLGEQGIEKLIADEEYLYVGSTLTANGLPNKPNESARFGILERATGKRVFMKEFEKAARVDVVGVDSTRHVALINADGVVWKVNTKALEIVGDPLKVPVPTSYTALCLANGDWLYGASKQLIKLSGQTCQSEVLAESDKVINNVARTPDGVLYVSCGAQVYKVVS